MRSAAGCGLGAGGLFWSRGIDESSLLTLCGAADVLELIRPLAAVGRDIERQARRAVHELRAAKLTSRVLAAARVARVGVQAELVLAAVRGQWYH